jgi:5-formyltetrahydrofolate cyclo-ligase
LKKSDCRSAYLKVRDSIPRSEKESLDRSVFRSLHGWEIYRCARGIFCFVSFRSEIDTRGILLAALAEGKTVSVPKVVASAREMKAYVVRDLERDLRPGYCGIPEPGVACEEAREDAIDLIIAPGIAFTTRGDRLGYGGGFYDRFFKMHYTITNCALTYDRLVVEALPVKEHDRAVDYLITETGVTATRSGEI